jgi:hypothetical protein
MARWSAKRVAIATGRTRMWSTNSLGMMSTPGNSPPKIRNESHVPITGMDRIIECVTLSPVPDSRSSGSV